MKTLKELTLENASLKQRLREEQRLVQRLTDELNDAQIKLEALKEQSSSLHRHSVREQDQRTPEKSVHCDGTGNQDPEVKNVENVESTEDADCVEILDCIENDDECVEIIDCTDDDESAWSDVEPAEGVGKSYRLASNWSDDTLIVMYGVKDIGPSEFTILLMHEALMTANDNLTKIKKSQPAVQLCEAIGLKYATKYRTMDDLKKLNCSRVMLMMDRNDKCAYIKTLIIHFLDNFWPELLRLPFLEQFVIPAVTVSLQNKVIHFSKLSEFELWKAARPNHHKYKIVHNKALAACTIEEIKEYLQHINSYRFEFKFDEEFDNSILSMQFSGHFEYKQAWINEQIVVTKRNKIHKLPEPLWGTARQITYAEFIYSELVPFYLNCKKRLPSMVDGLTAEQRKVISAFFQRNSSKSIKISEQSRSSADQQENELVSEVIIQLAQNYMGSNNINLLEHDSPALINWCGNSDMLSVDSASIKPSDLARIIFHPDDDVLLTYDLNTDQRSEPQFYVPIIPMILVNGYSCAGPYCLSQICQYNPRDLIQDIRMRLKKKMPPTMHPWSRYFTGIIIPKSDNSYKCYGQYCMIGENQIEITELPVGTWAIQYKENVLVPLTKHRNGSKPFIEKIEEYRTSRKVRFVLTLVPGALERMKSRLYKKLQLTTVMPLNNMFCFNENECIRKYETTLDILSAFYQTRLKFYKRRKDYQIAHLKKKVDQIIDPSKRRSKLAELRVYLKCKTPEMLWIDDLNALERKLDLIEKKERIDASADEEELITVELKENTNKPIEMYIDGKKQSVLEIPHDMVKDPHHEEAKLELHSLSDEEENADDIQGEVIKDPLHEMVKLELDDKENRDGIQDNVIKAPLYEVVTLEIHRLSEVENADDIQGNVIKDPLHEKENTDGIQDKMIKDPLYETIKLELDRFDDEVHRMLDIVDDPIHDIYGREHAELEMDTEGPGQEQCVINIKEGKMLDATADAEKTPKPKRRRLDRMPL